MVCLFTCIVIKMEPKEALASKYKVVVFLKLFSYSNVVFLWVQEDPRCSPDFAFFEWIPSFTN